MVMDQCVSVEKCDTLLKGKWVIPIFFYILRVLVSVLDQDAALTSALSSSFYVYLGSIYIIIHITMHIKEELTASINRQRF